LRTTISRRQSAAAALRVRQPAAFEQIERGLKVDAFAEREVGFGAAAHDAGKVEQLLHGLREQLFHERRVADVATDPGCRQRLEVAAIGSFQRGFVGKAQFSAGARG
jgi:hypothetical protein